MLSEAISEKSSCKLGDFAEIIMGQSPTGDTCNTSGLGFPLLNGPTEFGSKHPYPVQFTINPKRFAKPGDLLFCVRGSTTGKMNWADQDYAIGRGIAAIRGINEYPNSFIRAVIELKLESLLVQATGSTFPNVSRDLIHGMIIPCVSVDNAKMIASILDPMDHKIALNREMNKTLEAMAQAIFKSWFVDFEPFKEGEFVESELGMIPQGWEVKSIGDIAELAYGKALAKEMRQDGNIPVYGSGGITGFHNEALVKAPGIIIGRKGTVGSVYWSNDDFYPIDTVFYVKPKQDLSLYWIYEVLRTMDIKRFSADSAVPGVNRNVIQSQIVVISDIEIMQKFDDHIKSYIDLIDQNQKQIETLSTLRDTLLPKLLNGEIEV